MPPNPVLTRPALRRARRRFCGGALSSLLLPLAAGAAPPGASASGAQSRWFTTSDRVKLHYLEAGQPRPGVATLALVPGWTMPASIWHAQFTALAATRHVIALDPRGQGRSEIAARGYDYGRRGTDIAEWLAAARVDAAVLVGWSLGVLESLRLLHDTRGSPAAATVRGLVLVDNSVGEGEPPPGNPRFFQRLRQDRNATVHGFVKSMFKRPIAAAEVDAITEAALRTPLQHSIALLSQNTPREFWRETLYSLDIPVLYAHTDRFSRQAELVRQRKPAVRTALFEGAGHALFIDDAAPFNELLAGFANDVDANVGRPR